MILIPLIPGGVKGHQKVDVTSTFPLVTVTPSTELSHSPTLQGVQRPHQFDQGVAGGGAPGGGGPRRGGAWGCSPSRPPRGETGASGAGAQNLRKENQQRDEQDVERRRGMGLGSNTVTNQKVVTEFR